VNEFLADHPMAIASGVSIQNINDYKGIANYLLVATSITSSGEMIMKDKLIELKEKCL
jgi:predicted TIM-barrel enzyme